MNTKNRGWEEGDGDQKPRDTAAVIKNVRGEQHKIKIEDLGRSHASPHSHLFQRLVQLNMINPNTPNPSRLWTLTLPLRPWPCQVILPRDSLESIHLREKLQVVSALLTTSSGSLVGPSLLVRFWRAVGLFLLTFLLSPLTPQGWLLKAFKNKN